MVSYLLLALLILTIGAYYIGLAKARHFTDNLASSDRADQQHSLSSYHGAFMAAWAGIPALFLILIWLLFQNSVIDHLLLSSLPAERTAGLDKGQINLLLSEIKSIAKGNIFGTPDDVTLAAAERYNSWQNIASMAMVALSLALAVIAAFIARSRLAPRFRARNSVERIMTYLMIGCSLIAILTTFGIVLSLLYETARFFAKVPITEFFFGLNWEPQIAMREDQGLSGGGAFGAIPVFTGTLLIALLAMMVATPIGLFAAIYLVEYASAGRALCHQAAS